MKPPEWEILALKAAAAELRGLPSLDVDGANDVWKDALLRAVEAVREQVPPSECVAAPMMIVGAALWATLNLARPSGYVDLDDLDKTHPRCVGGMSFVVFGEVMVLLCLADEAENLMKWGDDDEFGLMDGRRAGDVLHRRRQGGT